MRPTTRPPTLAPSHSPTISPTPLPAWNSTFLTSLAESLHATPRCTLTMQRFPAITAKFIVREWDVYEETLIAITVLPLIVIGAVALIVVLLFTFGWTKASSSALCNCFTKRRNRNTRSRSLSDAIDPDVLDKAILRKRLLAILATLLTVGMFIVLIDMDSSLSSSLQRASEAVTTAQTAQATLLSRTGQVLSTATSALGRTYILRAYNGTDPPVWRNVSEAADRLVTVFLGFQANATSYNNLARLWADEVPGAANDEAMHLQAVRRGFTLASVVFSSLALVLAFRQAFCAAPPFDNWQKLSPAERIVERRRKYGRIALRVVLVLAAAFLLLCCFVQLSLSILVSDFCVQPEAFLDELGRAYLSTDGQRILNFYSNCEMNMMFHNPLDTQAAVLTGVLNASSLDAAVIESYSRAYSSAAPIIREAAGLITSRATLSENLRSAVRIQDCTNVGRPLQFVAASLCGPVVDNNFVICVMFGGAFLCFALTTMILPKPSASAYGALEESYRSTEEGSLEAFANAYHLHRERVGGETMMLPPSSDDPTPQAAAESQASLPPQHTSFTERLFGAYRKLRSDKPQSELSLNGGREAGRQRGSVAGFRSDSSDRNAYGPRNIGAVLADHVRH